MDSATLVKQLRELDLWPEDSALRQSAAQLAQAQPDGRLLARELLKRDLLTPYQANQLLTGKGATLAVGPYRIQERLGEGRHGRSVQARHARMHRVVALKLLRPELVAKPVVVERFCGKSGPPPSSTTPTSCGPSTPTAWKTPIISPCVMYRAPTCRDS